MNGCAHWAASKAKKNNINKKSNHIIASKPEHILFGDTAIIKKPKIFDVKIPRPNWYMMVDELSQIKFSFFHEKKNLIVEPSFSMISKWKENGNKVDFFGVITQIKTSH